MKFITDVFAGWIKGLIYLDPIIFINTVMLAALIGFPSLSDRVLTVAISPVIETQQAKVENERQRTEVSLLEKVKNIPVSDYQTNLTAYQKLSGLRPENEKYSAKVSFYKNLLEEERSKKEAKEKYAQAQRIKAAKLANEKAARIAKRKAERARVLKQKRRLASLAASKERVEKIKNTLRKRKWKGDLLYRKNGQTYLVNSSISTKFDEKLGCVFRVSKNMTNSSRHGNSIEYRFNTDALLNNFLGNNSAKTYATVTKNEKVVINVSGIDDQGGWSPNGKWVGRLQDGILKLSLGPFSAKLKKTYN